MTSLLLHGNAYGLVTGRDGFQFPTTVEWLAPEMISIHDDTTSWNPLRVKILYGDRELPRQDVFHVRAFARPGRFEGVSPIRNFAETIGGGLAAQKYGNDWYANGGFPPGTFKNTQQTVDQEAAEVVKARLNRAIASRSPLVYGADWDYNPVAVPPDEAQFLGAAKLTATQVAAIYDIPPERLAGEPGGSLTYATQEQNQIQLALTVQKWCTRIEDALFGMLPERQYVKFNVDAMIRTDTKTRRDVFKIDREIGLKSIDELRELEDLEPLPNGEGTSFLPLEAQIAEAKPRRALEEPDDEAQPRRPRLVS
jgi:HK97 family phage portal protein